MFGRLPAATVLAAAFLLSSVSFGGAQSLPGSKRCPEPTRSPFRYVIVHNDEIEGITPDGTAERIRIVGILLDRKAFSEMTLSQLFKLVSNRLSKTERLFVHVHTDLDDVETPEEADQILPHSQCNSLDGNKSAWALYSRTKEYEGFDYSTNEPGSSVKTVRLRSKP